jgi:TRAP-type C4-dicarboxylate transport system permease large subunit
MDPVAIAALGLAGMFVLIFLHVPVGIAMGVAGVVGFALLGGFWPALAMMATEASSTFSSLDLATIPLFVLMGSFAGAAGLSEDLYRLAYALVGHRRGGLAMATVGGCAGFGAVCGSSVATAATFGRASLPSMIGRDYAPGFAAGTVAAGGTLGILIPPSSIMVIYAVLAQELIITLYVAALLPALLALMDTASNTAMVYVIIAGAALFSYFVTLTQAPPVLVSAIGEAGVSGPVVIGLLLLMYIVLGAVFDEMAALVITMPFVLPLVKSLGYDAVWWGVINVVVCQLGMIVPPIGINVFVIHGLAPDIRLAAIYRGVMPYIAADGVRLALLAAFPLITLWLPAALRN